jgi:leucyl-tRNA synthetase
MEDCHGSLATTLPAYEPVAIEKKWQQAWRAADLFTARQADPSRSDVYVSTIFSSAPDEAHIDHVRSHAIADAYARFRRACGDAVLFSPGIAAVNSSASAKAEWEFEWVEWLGLSLDWRGAFECSDLDVHRWAQSLFLALLDAGLIHRREALVDWCDACGMLLAQRQVQNGRCPRCLQPVRPIRRAAWWLRASVYNEENERRLDELVEWNEVALATQRCGLGRIDGVEFDASTAEGVCLTVFTPFPDAIGEARCIVVPPDHPNVDDWSNTASIRAAVDDLQAAGGHRAAAKPIVLDTGMTLHVQGLQQALPVVISPALHARLGATATLAIPSADPSDEAITRQVERDGGKSWRARERLETRPAVRYRAADLPISRPGSIGVPIPVVHCEECGIVPVAREELPMRALTEAVQPCPACNAPARRELDVLDESLEATWRSVVGVVPAQDRAHVKFDHLEIQRWLGATRFVAGIQGGTPLLDHRAVAKALRDSGMWGFLPTGEPSPAAFLHGHLGVNGLKSSEDLGAAADPLALMRRFGADAVRFAVLHVAAPAKAVTWDDGALVHCARFLERLWAFAEPRLRVQGELGWPAEIATDDPLRRRLGGWHATAIRKITENLERSDMHKVTRNAITLLERIEDFEDRARERRGDLVDEDREAIATALATLVQLVAPIAPHLAEELWKRAGFEGFIAEAPWPPAGTLSTPHRLAWPQTPHEPSGDITPSEAASAVPGIPGKPPTLERRVELPQTVVPCGKSVSTGQRWAIQQ